MSDFEILKWSDVKPIWDNHLWPGRDSQPVTSMKYLGGYDMDYKKQTARFIGFVDDDGLQVVAVNSYVPTLTTGKEWRSRGLWVHPKYRGLGYARDILQYMIDDVQKAGGKMIWTMPRRGAMEAYYSVGFEQISDWIKQDWGVNCYARINLDV